MNILVIPTRHERNAVLKALPGAIPVPDQPVLTWQAGNLRILESGMGMERVTALLPHLDMLLSRNAPNPGQEHLPSSTHSTPFRGACAIPPDGGEAVWLFGWCGGLSTDLGVSDLVLADCTVLGDGQSIAHPPDGDLVAHVEQVAQNMDQRFVAGPVLTSERVLITVADKEAGRATGAVAVEMEAGPLARWAVDRGLSFVHLRVVLDPATSALPPERKRPKRRTRSALGATLQRYLVRPPRDWPAIWRLGRQFVHASRTMTRTIAALTQAGGPLGAED
jgi:hypothetical protein